MNETVLKKKTSGQEREKYGKRLVWGGGGGGGVSVSLASSNRGGSVLRRMSGN